MVTTCIQVSRMREDDPRSVSPVVLCVLPCWVPDQYCGHCISRSACPPPLPNPHPHTRPVTVSLHYPPHSSCHGLSPSPPSPVYPPFMIPLHSPSHPSLSHQPLLPLTVSLTSQSRPFHPLFSCVDDFSLPKCHKYPRSVRYRVVRDTVRGRRGDG